MKPLGIRRRILFAVLAPATLVAVLLTGILVNGQVQQARSEMQRRMEAVARQISSVAEYNIFVGNNEALRAQLESALHEPDLVAAAITDMKGKLLAGTVPEATLPKPGDILDGFPLPTGNESPHHWHAVSIVASRVGEPDLFDPTLAQPAKPIGRLLLKVSSESVRKEAQHRILLAGFASALILAFGALLAIFSSHNLIRLLERIREVVEQVGHGAGRARVEETGHDELGQLAEGINRMADRVEVNRTELASQVSKATADLRKEKEDAEAAALARSRFFASASHDLRQPVQALGLFATRLEAESRGSSLQPQIHLLMQSVRSLQGLLDTLLDYSRISGKVYRTDLRPVSATNAISAIATEFAPTAAAKNLKLRHRVRGCWLMTDPALLHRILINLVSNALLHTRRGGVLVACRRRGMHARIEVWDTGPGIPADKQNEIFEELVQLDNPERDASKGLGLGLAIVKRTAELLGYPLQLRSRLGKGSCFSITIPLVQAPDDHPGIAKSEESPETTARILVRCNIADDLHDLSRLIGDWGYAPTYVSTEAEALLWIRHFGPPALLLWDTGGDFTAALDELNRLDTAVSATLPALLIHAGPTPHFGTRNPLRLLLSRPFRPARLRALITHLLGREEEMNSVAQEES